MVRDRRSLGRASGPARARPAWAAPQGLRAWTLARPRLPDLPGHPRAGLVKHGDDLAAPLRDQSAGDTAGVIGVGAEYARLRSGPLRGEVDFAERSLVPSGWRYVRVMRPSLRFEILIAGPALSTYTEHPAMDPDRANTTAAARAWRRHDEPWTADIAANPPGRDLAEIWSPAPTSANRWSRVKVAPEITGIATWRLPRGPR
jgi:hypothetical protein